MPLNPEYFHRVFSGEDRSLGAKLLRTFGTMGEPAYATINSLRNKLYSTGKLKSHRLPRPVISVGNITTGGTGKTPVVQWLANRLREEHRHPAVLMRGYRPSPAGISDEQQVLHRALNDGSKQTVPVVANPSRVEGATIALREQAETDVFILDDGFQHRKVQRDFNLVLISATLPFGFGHVLPRGLLREPLRGLGRADAFLITRAGQISAASLTRIKSTLRRYHSTAPVFHCDHVHTGLWLPQDDKHVPITNLKDKRVLVVTAIAGPEGFTRQIESHSATIVDRHWFPDHHAFTAADISKLLESADQLGVDLIVTSEKDWVKLTNLQIETLANRFAVTELQLQFTGHDETGLLDLIRSKITR